MFDSFSRQSDKYGDVHFVSFLAAILSRLAYFNDNNFLPLYMSIMGPVVPPQLLQKIDSVSPSKLSALLNDQLLFGLDKSDKDMFKNAEYQNKGQTFIDVMKLNMPQNVNNINGDLPGAPEAPILGQPTPPPNCMKYISIGWSNYGEIYVVADKRMPTTLFVLFRGTYSAKTASLYSKPTSIIPLTVCTDSQGNKEQFLYGIFKTTAEMIHTIVEAASFLATDFLKATATNSVKLFES